MKYLPLLWAGMWRKRSRAILMLLQIATAFVLFGVLQGLDTGVAQIAAQSHEDRLYVNSSVAAGDPLPIGLLSRIRSISGVEYVTARADVGCTYQNPNQNVSITAANASAIFKVYNEVKVSPAAVEQLETDRAAAIVGVVAMQRYGWKVGEHIVLVCGLPKTDGSHDWGFDIVGEYAFPDRPENSAQVIANFSYINESRLTGRDHADMFVVRVHSPAAAGAVGLAIDNAFANSSNETHTQSEAELQASQLQQLGDLDFLAHAVIGAVFFALLFSTGALMMQSVREKVPELAVLKTIGFTDRGVMTLILFESIAFCVVAAAIGLGLSVSLLPAVRQLIGSVTHMPHIVFLEGAGCAVVLALAGAWIPAWRGSRLQVVDALAGR